MNKNEEYLEVEVDFYTGEDGLDYPRLLVNGEVMYASKAPGPVEVTIKEKNA